MSAAQPAILRLLDGVLLGLRGLSSAGIWLGGGLMLLLSVGIGAEVVMRSAFNHSFTGMDELGGYTLAIVAAIAFTETLFHRGHIRIDVLHGRLPRQGRALLDLLALASLILFFGLMLWYAHLLLLRSWSLNARSVSPLSVLLWVPQGIWFTALAVFILSAVMLFLSALAAMICGDLTTVSRLIGIKGADDELADERALTAAARGEDHA